MARRKLPYIPGELQFITSSIYRRTPLFGSERCCRCFVDALADVRKSTGFLLIGWVLMPEHFHLLLKPESAEATSRIMQRLKSRAATRFSDRNGQGGMKRQRPLASRDRRHDKARICATRPAIRRPTRARIDWFFTGAERAVA